MFDRGRGNLADSKREFFLGNLEIALLREHGSSDTH